MQIPPPTSLSDIITDGFLAQTGVDRAFATRLGRIRGVEFNLVNGTENTPIAQVRINRAQGEPFDTTGTVVAWINGEEFTWAGEQGAGFDIPELHGTQPLSDELIRAARTLHGNAPAFIAPFGNRGQALVVLNDPHHPTDIRTDLVEGLALLPPHADAHRALSSYAAFRGLGIQRNPSYTALSNGTAVTFRQHRPIEVTGGLTLRDVRADSAFSSAEHQLLFDALSPTRQVSYNPQAGTAVIEGQLEVSALPLATIDGGVWRWAWADTRVRGQGSGGLRQFGVDNGLLPLVSPTLPVAQANQLDLTAVAKPVLQLWTHAIVNTGEGFQTVLLLNHPRLHLPPASHAAIEATLHTRLDPELDARRAVAAYATQRQVPFDGSRITVDNRHITMEFRGNQIGSIS